MKGLGNLANLMKQAQQLQQRLSDIQQELEQVEVSASSGGGMVTVTMNGKQKIIRIQIEPEVVKAEEISMLQDLILVAVNEAQDRVQEIVKERMSSLTGGISIPGITP